jgi:hypothetical protein
MKINISISTTKLTFLSMERLDKVYKENDGSLDPLIFRIKEVIDKVKRSKSTGLTCVGVFSLDLSKMKQEEYEKYLESNFGWGGGTKKVAAGKFMYYMNNNLLLKFKK